MNQTQPVNNQNIKTGKTDSQGVLGLENKIKNVKNKVSFRIIFLGVINLFLLASLVFALFKVRSLSAGLSSIESTDKPNLANLDVLRSQLASNKTKVENMENYIASEVDIIDYVQSLDNLKNAGDITDFSFVSNEKINDKTSNSGYLLKITINGDLGRIENTINNINNLPFLARPVSFEMARDENVYNVVYDVILYTNE